MNKAYIMIGIQGSGKAETVRVSDSPHSKVPWLSKAKCQCPKATSKMALWMALWMTLWLAKYWRC